MKPHCGPYQGLGLLYNDHHGELWRAHSTGGAPGSVAHALHQQHTEVLLRWLPKHHTPSSTVELDVWWRRCARLRRAHHPCLQRVFDGGISQGRIFIIEAEPSGRPLVRPSTGARLSGTRRHANTTGQDLLVAVAHLASLAGHPSYAGPARYNLSETSMWWSLVPKPQLQLVGLCVPSMASSPDWSSSLSQLWDVWGDEAPVRPQRGSDGLQAWLHVQKAANRPERAQWGKLQVGEALALVRAWLYEGEFEQLLELVQVRPLLVIDPLLSRYLWDHLGGALQKALQGELLPWQEALLGVLPQANKILEANLSRARALPLWIGHQAFVPWSL